ncbi:unnamed protein product [Larinioides sclopetarius]|uniref:Uncharacterized protein n=1 Tax=Larinioides sclopetarius TaxID=280406 RepID=A0AAV1ZL94_9ARAC
MSEGSNWSCGIAFFNAVRRYTVGPEGGKLFAFINFEPVTPRSCVCVCVNDRLLRSVKMESVWFNRSHKRMKFRFKNTPVSSKKFVFALMVG